MSASDGGRLFQPLQLPCGVVLKNRIAKSAMSDSLGDGCGGPSDAQVRLYERWGAGGLALSIIGEVLTSLEIQALPDEFASTATRAKALGFGGVEIHAAHGFLLSQFLSPLFNQRKDAYGGSLENRMRLLLEVIDAVRRAVGPLFPIGVKLNATDQLDGGFQEDEALGVVATYFPGAASSSDRAGSGPYFLEFASRAKAKTAVPLMVTGGFKTLEQAKEAIVSGMADVVGLARALIVDPQLPMKWQSGLMPDPQWLGTPCK